MDGGHTEGNRIIKEGYEMCLDRWQDKHKKCVDNVVKRLVITYRMQNKKMYVNHVGSVPLY